MLRLQPIYTPLFLHQQSTLVSVGSATEVGAGGVSTAAGGIVFLVAAGVEGAFAYALYTGKWIFTNKHPVWGTIFALLTMSNLYAAGNRLTER